MTLADAHLHYPEWKAPAADGLSLIWPAPDELLQDTLENQRRLSRADSIHLQNIPLPALRSDMRRFLGHDDAGPMIATGHQTELYHSGVWVKDALIDAAARRINGQAYHFAVDTDHPKHLHLRWPGHSLPISDDPSLGTAAWSALLQSPTPHHLGLIEQAIASDRASFGYEPDALLRFLSAMKLMSMEPTNLSSMITNAQHQLDWDLGLRHHAMIVSPMLQSPGYLAFVHHLIARSDELAGSYNRSLADYRTRTGTSNPMRPMPDLFVSDESIETPFWLDDLATSTRTRPSVFRVNGAWQLKLVSGEEFTFNPQSDGWQAAEELRKFLARTSHRLSPRALTLTTFLRLVVVDQFVHGIGGGRYDQVADDLIQNFFGLAAPKFSVTTATLYFPGAIGRERVCLPCLAQRGHQLKHAVLGDRKRELVEQIAANPRRSPQREELFLTLHRERRAALAASVEMQEWEASFKEAESRQQEESVLFDRELFHAVQSRSRLLEMIEHYRQSFA